jgi:hypothetical protein
MAPPRRNAPVHGPPVERAAIGERRAGCAPTGGTPNGLPAGSLRQDTRGGARTQVDRWSCRRSRWRGRPALRDLPTPPAPLLATDDRHVAVGFAVSRSSRGRSPGFVGDLLPVRRRDGADHSAVRRGALLQRDGRLVGARPSVPPAAPRTATEVAAIPTASAFALPTRNAFTDTLLTSFPRFPGGAPATFRRRWSSPRAVTASRSPTGALTRSATGAIAVTYPTKYKQLRATLSRSCLRRVHATIRSNEGVGMEHELPYRSIRNSDSGTHNHSVRMRWNLSLFYSARCCDQSEGIEATWRRSRVPTG